MSILFALIFIIGIYCLIRDFINLKKAIRLVENAIFPVTEEHFSNVLIAGEWKIASRLSKRAKSYHIVKWGTGVALVLLAALLVIVIYTDWLGSYLFSSAYLFYMLLNAVKHPGNFYIVPNGIILQSKFISYSDITDYSVERIVRWHNLYGYDSRVNNGFKVSFDFKKKLTPLDYVVITERKELETVIELLDAQGIHSKKQIDEPPIAAGFKGDKG
ncbi:hypothetical protein [Bacillus sp. FJAT-27445]|uniref:hypothetical protein n=1 Tax=Bacillus sp. FJAT-27445 TaxID=1679166 RepID=UPI000743DA9D|nr:hypothetical protein [Bacillus sp. FJAT-27445]